MQSISQRRIRPNDARPYSLLVMALVSWPRQTGASSRPWIGRQGYGLTTPEPDHTIASFARLAIAVADHLHIDRFVACRELEP